MGDVPLPPGVSNKYIIVLTVELQHNRRKIEILIDVVYINDQIFLQLVNQTIQLKYIFLLRTKKKVENYDVALLYKEINNILRYYNKVDVYIGEFGIIIDDLNNNREVGMNIILLGTHIMDIKRNKQVL